MPKFEVLIPPADPGGFNVTLRVDAANWMAALKTGLQKLGEQGSNVQNVLVDIQDDNSIHVTESRSGRVFRIRELSEQEVAAAKVRRTLKPAPLAELQRAEKTSHDEPTQIGQRPSENAEAVPAGKPIGDPAPAATLTDVPPPSTVPARKPGAEPARPSRPAISLSSVTEPAIAGPVARPAPPPTAPTAPAAPPKQPASRPPPKARHEPDGVFELETPTRPAGSIGRPRPKAKKEEIEDLLAEVFERVQDIYTKPDESSALYYLLDLALEKVPCESGSVFKADMATGDLSFLAVRGPKAKDLLASKLIVPAGAGIVGFCATEGVSLAISDAEKDPRFYSAITEKLNYETRSMLCAPMMTHGRTFGCIQLLNKKDSPTFTEHEVGLLSYIAHQAALYLNARS